MGRHVNQAFFSTWCPNMAYILGFWFADGWMTQSNTDASVCFVSKDREHLELIRNAMQSEHPIHPQGTGCFRLYLGSKQLWHDLYQLGGRPAKSLVAEMPFVPQELVHHFVRGFVDGDGCLYWNALRRPTPRIHVFGGQSFLEALALVIDQETGVGIVPVRVHNKHVLVLSYPGIKAKVLAKWMYIPGHLALERKAAIARGFGRWELSKFGWKSQAAMTSRMQQILAS
jgi:hypothetical protein